MRITVVDWNTNFRLCENFARKGVHLDYPADVLGVDIDSFSTKKEKAEAMAKYVLDNAKAFVWRLTEFELEIVRSLVMAGHGKAARFRQSSCVIPMSLISVVNIHTSPEEERTTIWMADELLDAIAPFVTELEENEEFWHHKELERYVIGLTCLYGPLLKDEVRELLEEFYEDEDVEEAFRLMHENLIHTICVSDVEIEGELDIMYYPPYINIVDDEPLRCYHERLSRDVRQNFKDYDFEQILAAGNMTDLKIPNSVREKLIRALGKYSGKARPVAEGDVFQIWQAAEMGMDPRDIVDHVLSWCDTMKDAKALQKILVQYLNNIPMWCLKGYSSLEMLAIDHTKVGVTSRFGDRRNEPEMEDLELFGDTEIERLDDDYDGFSSYMGFPVGEA